MYVPDLFHGDAVPSTFMKLMPEVPGEKLSIGTKLSYAGKTVTLLGPWIIRHRQAVTLPLVERFFKVD